MLLKKKLSEIKNKYKTYRIDVVGKEKNKRFVEFYLPQQKKLGGKRPIPKVALDTGCFFNRMIGMPHKGEGGWEFIDAYSKTKGNLDRFKKGLKGIGR